MRAAGQQGGTHVRHAPGWQNITISKVRCYENTTTNMGPGNTTVQVTGHNVAVTAIRMEPSAQLGQPPNMQAFTSWNQPITIKITVQNLGTFPENFTVTAYNGSTPVGPSQPVTDLAPGNKINLTFTWDHRSVNPLPRQKAPVFVISAVATLEGDSDPGDNSLSDGAITVKHPGDTEGDGKVGGLDLNTFAAAWGEGVVQGKPYRTPQADFDGDEKVGGTDLDLFAANWGWGVTWP
jgi:hypothetical protein